MLTAAPAPYADVVLLERHGAVAVGPDLATAIDRLELVEVLCRTWRDSLLIRAARATVGQRSSDRQRLDRPGSIDLAQTAAARQRSHVEGQWKPASTWPSWSARSCS